MTEHIAHSGAWGLALIMIVVASWLVYRYLAPGTWREWAGAGLVQAFIIALYAEMYGFPLTIYLLVRVFGLDRHYVSANLWSTLLGLGEAGMMISMIAGYVLLFMGIGLFAEGWREVFAARKEGRLVTARLYAYVRHPQYLGLLIGLFGEGIVHWPTIFSVGLFPIIAAVYFFLARKEERAMLVQCGVAYRQYMRSVPMFVPGWGKWRGLIEASGGSRDRKEGGAMTERHVQVPDHRGPSRAGENDGVVPAHAPPSCVLDMRSREGLNTPRDAHPHSGHVHPTSEVWQ